MPMYFAYGSNMDVAAMSTRCPGAQPMGLARLPRHRFALMADGYATVERDVRGTVWGVLWSLGLADVRPLDAYESVASGLYVKASQPVLKAGGGSVRALIYIGAHRSRTGGSGRAEPGYGEAIFAAATAWQMPDTYLRELATRLDLSRAGRAPATESAPQPLRKVRPRFATPFDR